MSVLATLAIVSFCSWDNPGADPYRGPVAASVHRYKDIPKDVRDKLQARMEKKQYDEVATISRDRIHGKHEYTGLRDMHFGNGRICETVSRTKWKPDAVERGLVYCEKEHCIIVPTVCNNVSRVTRVPKQDPAPKGGGGGSAPPVVPPASPELPATTGSGGTPTPIDPVTVAVPPLLPVAPPPGTFNEGSRPWAPPVFFPSPPSWFPWVPAPVPPGTTPPELPEVSPELPPELPPVMPPVFPPLPPVLPPIDQPPVGVIPEPSTYALLLGGLGMLALVRRRKK